MAKPVDHEPDSAPDVPSRTKKKQRAGEISELATLLTRLPPERLGMLELDETLLDAIVSHGSLRGSALGRQKRYIAQLLRERDHDDIVERINRRRVRPGPDDRISLGWLKRLVDEGDVALNAFLDEHPGADRPRLRGLMRNARGPEPSDARARANDKLLKLIRGYCRSSEGAG